MDKSVDRLSECVTNDCVHRYRCICSKLEGRYPKDMRPKFVQTENHSPYCSNYRPVRSVR